MYLKWSISRICIIILSFVYFTECKNIPSINSDSPSRNINFNRDWAFIRSEDSSAKSILYSSPDFNDSGWDKVELPHTPVIEPLVVNNQWQGICWYRKNFRLDSIVKGKKIFIEFEGAMQIADVWINGLHKTTHYGGYLPFMIDISEDVLFDRENVIAVKLDNRDNPEVPPGKPLTTLDFCIYGGLYRNVNLHITDKLHISDAVYSGKTAGGGIFVRYPMVSEQVAQISVRTHVYNEYPQNQLFKIISRIIDASDRLVIDSESEEITLKSMQDGHYDQLLTVRDPRLWHPDSPYLYRLQSIIEQSGKVIDELNTIIGIRKISFSAAEGFKINNEPFYIRGTNRHQEYPYIGYALSDNAHFRDALEIKKAGFDFVRLSHYPHSTSFLDACDQLGILVMDAIPGWQFFGNEMFQQRSYQDCRDMIRRDRNHPSVIAWEVSLNESAMSREFMANCHAIAHEEYPGDQCYTAGWLDQSYDIFIPARQHAHPPDYWDKYDKDKPLFIAEYGDWEYYAQNAGFNQEEFENLSPQARTSRQLRSAGEKRLLQQVLNYQESFNDNLDSPAVGCANWLVFDYNRGYADDIEASGIMDIFRIPKFSYYFYKSQRKVSDKHNPHYYADPFVFIADYYTPEVSTKIKIFSNCEKITLKLNGKEIATQNPDVDHYSSHLLHPPYTFNLEKYEPGALTAIGYIDDKEVAEYSVKTPLVPERIVLSDNCLNIRPALNQKDVFFVYASIIDKNGTLVPTAEIPVTFNISGPGALAGNNRVTSEAGIATILIQSSGKKGTIKISAENKDLGISVHEIVIE